MQYHSTRSLAPEVDSAQAVLQGIADDGGLFMPKALPAFDWKACVASEPMEMAVRILSSLLPDIPDMITLVEKANGGKFETDALTPTV